MKLPLKWAQSFAFFTTTPEEFAAKMTMSGSKVETYDSEAWRMKNVVIGRIAAIERHPDSDHLWICRVDIGDGASVQIVTGAQNLSGGELCPVALHGAKLPNGTEIKRGKLRGVESEGMLCSLSELGLTLGDFPHAVEDGILTLEEDVVPGTDAAVALGMDDVTFEFEITPNRPDCLSVRGLAREAAATYGVPFEDHIPTLSAGSGDSHTLLRVKIEADDICMRYSAAMVDNVRIKESPRWLRERLRHAGVRPINNIVDITNYVMLEYGQPMHAFDYAYVNGGAITVRRARANEQIVTLDDVQRPLEEDMLVIADEQGPIAVAGIMGGEYSGVYDTTKQVVFESASFHGPSVRSTSKKLGLRTESSTRFEKGLDPENVAPALRRALELVAELDAGDVMEGLLDDYPAPRETRAIPLRVDAINNLLGIELSRQEMIALLLPLDFKIQEDLVVIPTARADVSRDCDLAEEVARFVGYNKIPSTVMRGVAAARPTARQTFDEMCCTLLAGYGLWECQTFSFYSPKCFDIIRVPQDDALRHAVKIMNPLGEDTSIMRTTALPSILEVAARNWAARSESCAVFEPATVYIPGSDENALPDEWPVMTLAAYGSEWDYLSMKGMVEALFAAADIQEFTIRRNGTGTSYHPGRCADIYVSLPAKDTTGGASTEHKLATIGEIHPAVCAAYGIKPRVVAAEIRMDILFAVRGATPQYRPLPKFPATTRDLALVADAAVPAADIVAIIRKAAGKRLEALSLFDVYTDEKLGTGKKSLAYNLVLRDADTTLTDQDADAITTKILKNLTDIGVVLRS